MKEVLGGIALLGGLGVLLHVNLGQRDRRFKTGYKNNQVPTQMPMGPRLKWTAGLWIIGGLCLADPSLLSGLAVAAVFAVAAILTWKLYPQFWSRFQRNTTSNAAFVAARLSMCAAIGGMAAYGTWQGIGDLPHASASLSVPSPTSTSSRDSVAPVSRTSGASAGTSTGETIESSKADSAFQQALPVEVPVERPPTAVADSYQVPEPTEISSRPVASVTTQRASNHDDDYASAESAEGLGARSPKGQGMTGVPGARAIVDPQSRTNSPSIPYASENTAVRQRYANAPVERAVVVPRGGPPATPSAGQFVGPQGDGP